MKSRHLYIITIILLCILLVASNLYQWDRQIKIKENVEESINQRLSTIYDVVAETWVLTPDTDVSETPDLMQDLEVLYYLTGIYGQFFGNSEHDKVIISAMGDLTYMLGDYTTVYYAIGEGLPYEQSKDILQRMNAYFSLVGNISDVNQHDLEERLLAFYEADSEEGMREKHGSLGELRSAVNRLSEIYKKD